MYQNLNKKQKIIFNRIVTHYNDTILDHQVEMLRILIMRTARTRKSYFIKAIRGQLHTIAENRTKLPVIVITPTGVAAFNINRATIHSTLSILIMNNKKFELNSIHLK